LEDKLRDAVPDFIRLPDPLNSPAKVPLEDWITLSPFPAMLMKPIVEVPLKLFIEVATATPVTSNTPSTSTEDALLIDPLAVSARVPELTVKAPV
jgi:hypothetical protein